MSIIEMTPEWVSKMIEIILSRLSDTTLANDVRLAMNETLDYYIAVQASFGEVK